MLASSELTSQILALICKKLLPHGQLRAPLCLPDNFSTNTFVSIYPYRCATRLPYCHPWQGTLPACPFADTELADTGLANTPLAPFFSRAGLPHCSASYPVTSVSCLGTTKLQQASFCHLPAPHRRSLPVPPTPRPSTPLGAARSPRGPPASRDPVTPSPRTELGTAGRVCRASPDPMAALR